MRTELPKLNDSQFVILFDVYNNPGLFNAFYKPRITQQLIGRGLIEITFPPGYDEGRLYATQLAEDFFVAEKAKLEAGK